MFGSRFCCLDSGRSGVTFSADVDGYPVCTCTVPTVVEDDAEGGL